MFLSALALAVGFAVLLGGIRPFARTFELRVAYNFAGGLEVGSPVRVMGIKVGKVRAVEFKPEQKMETTGEEVKLLVTIDVDKQAWPTLRRDSQYFINLAGVIGEKFLEISAGTLEQPELTPGQMVRGEDPPRIDQLISQSYAVAGKILEFVTKNEGSMIQTLDTLNKLVVNFDRALKQLERTSKDPEVMKIVKNLGVILDDGAFFSRKLRGPDGQKTMALLNDLIHRLDPLNAETIKKFLQREGIRAHIF
jgi:phospholipid/cholesterol/gamma-HCH transport system substrate-binding protein